MGEDLGGGGGALPGVVGGRGTLRWTADPGLGGVSGAVLPSAEGEDVRGGIAGGAA